ncbi:MAG TPA: enoyl-CoA hydratase-related protein [Polyangiaceae bacterium]|jgi:enoyl-CoA hydratase/carnithine racemase|nr:enoyl-CoA hydratase-related protein [Polyangiaceae bacterium]
MDEKVLLVDRDGPVATLTLNRPRTKNALNTELVTALREAIPAVASDPSVRAVVLTGAGGAFCSGADLKAGLSSGGSDVGGPLDALHDVIRAITRAPKPFVAAVDGAAVGFGCDLALACDLRVLSTRGYLQEIFVKIGLMPDGGGTFSMQRLVGLGRAMEYLMLGTRIDAELARDVGLANRVVESSGLAATAAALAAELAKGPPLAVARIKQAVREGASGGIDDALAREKTKQLELLASSDVAEGVMAWAERRAPDFKGK